MTKLKRNSILTVVLFILFAVFTVLVKTVDVSPIGPQGSSVGFASVNGYVFETLGESDFWYELSDLFGKVSLLYAVGFALLGVYQLIKGKSFAKIDKELYALAGFYVLVGIAYVAFEVLVINQRPVLMDGVLEASYPSSHTMLVTCIMSSAVVMFSYLFKDKKLLKLTGITTSVLIMVITVVGRLLSGVHWFTDIIGGILLSAALVSTMTTAIAFLRKN